MLTKHQQQALDFNGHLSVTANAGAGKTTVLVRRFVDILMHTDAQVKQLVAITFTEKAASELRRKIAEHIEERLHTSQKANERFRLEQIRDMLASANIGTIHSFCAQLLREHPVEADVDAAFTVLEGIDQQFLEQETLLEAFESIMGTPMGSREREDLLNTVRMFGRLTVQSYLTALLRNREHIDRMLQPEGCFSPLFTDEEILKRWNVLIDDLILSSLDQSEWKEALHRILPHAKGKKAADVSSLFREWKSSLPVKEKIRLYHSLLSVVLTKEGSLRKEFIGSTTDTTQLQNEAALLSSHFKSLSQFLPEPADDHTIDGNRILLRITRTLLSTFQKVVERYNGKKFDQGLLDFEDLQIKTRELLRDETIRLRIAEKFSYIMVDEYQDTNQLQYDILRLLISNYQSGNLFIVGDPKQSIYGFRNAEVEIFEETKRDITSSSTHSSNGSVTMKEGFRLLSNNVDFVNRVFARTMGGNDSQFEVRYDELVKARANSAEGNIELLLIPPAADDNDNAVMNECRAIARRIADLELSGHIIYDPKDEHPRPFQYSDAAILLRKRTHLREIETAFSEFNIPYILSGGIGFYQTQEIYDFLNYFTFLLNPEDDVALAGILRSPFFALSDAELFEISLHYNAETLWNKLQKHEQRTFSDSGVRRALHILKEDLELANRLPIPFLVHRIFHHTGWHGTVSGLSLGNQNSANIQKLLRLAREFEGKGFITLYDFVERLKTLAANEEREGQASLDFDGNCVQVMTIHAAKGLEFPVVVLPFTDEKFRYDDSPFIDQEIGIGFKVKREDNFDDEVTPQLYSLLKHRSRCKTEAEEKRVFYVACTRARDMLVLSGKVTEHKHRSSCLQWVLDGLQVTPENLQQKKIVLPPNALTIAQQSNGATSFVEIQHSLPITILNSDERTIPQPLATQAQPSEVTPRLIFTGPLQSKIREEFFSATQIRTYMECPTKYYIKYMLGLPEEHTLPVSFDEQEEANDILRGELRGTITHKVLEQINSVTDVDTIHQITTNALREYASLNADEEVRIVDSIILDITAFCDSPFGKEILSAKSSHSEYTISTRFGEDYLTGTIDRLFMTEDGMWNIIDYKTDLVSTAEHKARAALYKPQLAVYAVLVHKLFNQKSVRASLLFLKHPNKPIHFVFSHDEILLLESDISSTIVKIKQRAFHRTLQQCETCSFQQNGKCLIDVNQTH